MNEAFTWSSHILIIYILAHFHLFDEHIIKLGETQFFVVLNRSFAIKFFAEWLKHQGKVQDTCFIFLFAPSSYNVFELFQLVGRRHVEWDDTVAEKFI